MLLYGGFGLLELAMGRLWQREHTTAKDVVIEVSSMLILPVLTVPLVTWGAALCVEAIAPGSQDRWAGMSPLVMFAVLLIADDLTQYWWHRLSHGNPWLFRLHRAHHSGNYISIRTVYRNNVWYYALMPGIWFSGALLYLGFGAVYPVYFVVKMLVIIGAHSNVPWDEPLLRNRYTRPIVWVLTRIISTPATHSAHHGRHASDGVTHYKGNYGNFLFLWDVLFGTAKISERRPEAFGLEDVEQMGALRELLWPFGPSRRV